MFKIISSLFIVLITLTACQNVKDGLTGQKKKNTDEFLVKKKDPLVIPPSFDDLPKPQTKKNENENEIENIDFSKVLTTPTSKKEIKTSDKSLERSISNILNNN